MTTRSELIESLLAFAPAPRGLTDKARENLARLSNEELENLGSRARRAADTIQRTSKDTNISGSESDRILTAGTKKLAFARQKFADANSMMERRLEVSPDTKEPFAPAAAGQMLPVPVAHVIVREDRPTTILSPDPEMQDDALHLRDTNIMSETRAVESLAILGAWTLEYQPDLLFSIDRGGRIVGNLLTAELGSEAGFQHGALYRTQAGFKLDERTFKVSNIKKILLVDDISRTGAAISDALLFLQNRFPDTELRATVIVGSKSAREKIPEDTFKMPNVTPDQTVRLPWKNSDSYFEKHDDYYFLGQKGNGLVIKRADLAANLYKHLFYSQD